MKIYRVQKFNVTMDEFTRNILTVFYGDDSNSQRTLENLICQTWLDFGSDVISKLREELGEQSELIDDKMLFLTNFDLFVHLAHLYHFPISQDRMTQYSYFVNSCTNHILERKKIKGKLFK